ncbi:hypothetical protein DFQ28_002931 [Apophysomyces sp. BC1034]|nr:hypothetical protein DFQ29_000217 [Apophysomyces sp. BC1021]KAG0194856.1 hypothetical protein DFQ28_002931 [Apophysomyces sp. BC1034]
MVSTMIRPSSPLLAQESKNRDKQPSPSSITALLNPEPVREDNKNKTTKSSRPQVPAKAKRKRISPDQFRALSELFEQTDTPNYELRERLAKKLNMTNREVQVWFQNRRAKRSRLQEQSQLKQSSLSESSKTVHLQSVDTSFSFRQSVHLPYVSKRRRDNREEDDDDTVSLPSVSSTESIPSRHHPHFCVTSIDILATAAACVQRWDEEQREREETERKRQRKEETRQVQPSWRPWL